MLRKRMWEIGTAVALVLVLAVLWFGVNAVLRHNNLNFSVEYNLMVLRRAPVEERFSAWRSIKGAILAGAEVDTRGKIFPKTPVPAGPGAEGCTALLVAVEMGDAAFVEELLKRGADAHAADQAGDTAMSLARKHRQQGIVRLLKQHGATK